MTLRMQCKAFAGRLPPGRRAVLSIIFLRLTWQMSRRGTRWRAACGYTLANAQKFWHLLSRPCCCGAGAHNVVGAIEAVIVAGTRRVRTQSRDVYSKKIAPAWCVCARTLSCVNHCCVCTLCLSTTAAAVGLPPPVLRIISTNTGSYGIRSQSESLFVRMATTLYTW